MVTVTLQPEFGYVVILHVVFVFVITWMGFQVGHARKLHGVPYPTMYASLAEHGEAASKAFNCVQRGHQNVLESVPFFIVLSLLSGLQWPVVTAGAMVVFILGKIAYFTGYASGNPDGRKRGSFAYIGVFTLIAGTVAFGLRLLQVV